MPNLITTTDAAYELGVSEATVRKYIHTGLLSADKRGSMWFIESCSLERLADYIQEDDEDENEAFYDDEDGIDEDADDDDDDDD